jgi:signal transduction histidine kinase
VRLGGATADVNYHRHTHLGLGLYIARLIVEGHGGEIAVRSNEAEGTFSLQLPRA